MSKSSKILEKSVQDALEYYYLDEGYVVKREVYTPVGYIDFLLYKDRGKVGGGEKILIEVKEHRNIKHAIGQVYSYKKYHSDVTESRIVYFCRDGKFRGIDHSYLSEKIRFQCVHTFIELEEIYKCQNESRSQRYSELYKTSSTERISPVIISGEISDQTETSMETLSDSEMESIMPSEMSMKSIENYMWKNLQW